MCADFGVVIGRVITNGGFGIPNAKVSIFMIMELINQKESGMMRVNVLKMMLKNIARQLEFSER